MLPPDERPGQGHRHATVTSQRARGSQYTNNRGNHDDRSNHGSHNNRGWRDGRGRRNGCKGREGLSEYCEPLARFFAL